MEIYWSTENKNSLLKFSKEMEQKISEYRKQFTQEDTMAGIHRFSKEGYGRQRSWVREGTEEGDNEPDKDGFTKLTKAEQLELPFDLPDKEKG